MKKPIPLNLLLNPQLHSTLWMWINLRVLHKHPIIRNFTYKDLAARSGFSHTCLRKHVKELIRLRWCRVTREGHLHFTGINKLKISYTKSGKAVSNACVLIPVIRNHNEQILALRDAVVRHNLDRQKKEIARKSALVKKARAVNGRLTKTELKLIARSGGLEKFCRTITDYCTLSNRRFGLLVGTRTKMCLSKWSGKILQKKLRAAGYISSKCRLVLVQTGCSRRSFLLMQSYNYTPGLIHNEKNNTVYRRLSNEIESIAKV